MVNIKLTEKNTQKAKFKMSSVKQYIENERLNWEKCSHSSYNLTVRFHQYSWLTFDIE